MTYLGHVVSADSIMLDPSIVQSTKEMQQPKYVIVTYTTLPRHGQPTRQVHSKHVDSHSATDGYDAEEQPVDAGTESTAYICSGEGWGNPNARSCVVWPQRTTV